LTKSPTANALPVAGAMRSLQFSLPLATDSDAPLEVPLKTTLSPGVAKLSVAPIPTPSREALANQNDTVLSRTNCVTGADVNPPYAAVTE